MNLFKRLTAICAALIMLVSFAACGSTENASTAESNETPAESGDKQTSGEDVSKPDNEENYVKTAALVEETESLFGSEVDRTLPAKNVFFRQSYTYSREPSESYPDKHMSLLTDGQTADMFDREHFVAWTGAKQVIIDFDLGVTKHSLADVDVYCLRQTNYGIGLPSYVEVMISKDGENYYSVGREDRPRGLNASDRVVYRIAFPRSTSARYVRVVCGAPDASFTFIDEIAGFDYRRDYSVDRKPGGDNPDTQYVYDFYHYSVDPKVIKTQVSESDADYNTVQNLMALDTSEFQCSHFEPIANSGNSNTTIAQFGKLKDGVIPESKSGTAGEWVVFYRGSGRHVIADLGCEMAVSEYKAVFLSNESSGIAIPPATYVSLSSDGENWVTVYGEDNQKYGSKAAPDIYTLDAKFKAEYKARYVRISFETVPSNAISSMVYIGEIEVIGRKNTANAVEPETNTDTRYGRYVMPEDIGGIHNILFAPVTDEFGVHCVDKNVILTKGALEYLYYRDENGELKGRFFDSVAMSVRGPMGYYKEHYDGMLFYYDELFNYEGNNLNALEEAQGIINEETGKHEKTTVWISVNCPKNGDTFRGKTISGIDEVMECLKWQADEIVKRYNEKGYENLEFVGYYWHHETLRENSYDMEALKMFTDYVHSKGLMLFWCPYYNSRGVWAGTWSGVDVMCVQPNYMFHTDATYDRLTSTADIAKIYGACVEIEIEDYSGSAAANRYYNYLEAGVTTGYMNAVKAYYMGGFPGAFYGSAISDVPVQRRVYDMTGKYATEVLTLDDIAFNHVDLTDFTDKEITVKSGEPVDFRLVSTTELDYRVLLSPVYGSFRLDVDGNAYYKPIKGFVGEEKLSIQLIDSNGELHEATVTFKVEK